MQCIVIERGRGPQAGARMCFAGNKLAIAFGKILLASYAILKFTAVDAAVPVLDDF